MSEDGALESIILFFCLNIMSVTMAIFVLFFKNMRHENTYRQRTWREYVWQMLS